MLIALTTEPGRALFATLTQVTASGTPGLQWNQNTSQWAASVAIADRTISLTEGTGADAGRYTGGIAVALGSYSGFALKQIHDSTLGNRVVGMEIVSLVSGVEQRDAISTDLTGLPLATWFEIQNQGGVTSTNMRGTDNALLAASYTAPDNAGITTAATQATTAATQSTTAATAASAARIAAESTNGRLTVARADNLDNLDAAITSRSTLTAAQVRTDINANGGVVSSNMRGTDNAFLAVSFIAPNNAGIATAAADATAAKIASEAVSARVTATRAGYLDNLSAGAVATQDTVNAITNTTRTKVVAPTEVQLPASGSRQFVVDLLLYDNAGNMEAPDSTPTITAANEAGVARSANLSAVSTVSTGHYRATYTVADTHAEEQVVFTWTAVEGASSLKATHSMTVVAVSSGSGFTTADRTKLESVFNKLPSKAYLTGTAAADGDIDLDQLDGDKSAFMADVSLLATAASVAALPAGVLTYANANGGIVSSNMRGTDAALLAANYTAPDNANIVVAATQSTTAATQSTTAATQATTAATQATTVATRLTLTRATNLDNLDATISSRSTFNSASNTVALTTGHGLATEATSTAIKAKTDLIPAQPAGVSDVPTTAQIATQVDTVLSAAHGAGAWTGSGGGDATEAKQDQIIASIAGIVPQPPSVAMVRNARTWRLYDDGENALSPNVVHLTAGVTVTLAMDFTGILNPGTAIQSVSAVTDLSANGLVATNLLPSQNRQQAHFDVTGLTAGDRHTLRVTVVTSDGQTLTGRGILEVI